METGAAQCAQLLILEDDPEMAWRLSRYVQRHGYLVQSVADATQALACVAHVDFAAVIADCRILWIPGEDCREAMRHLGGFRAVSVYTGVPDPSPDGYGEPGRVFCILMKDIPVQPLLRSVEEACRTACRAAHACYA